MENLTPDWIALTKSDGVRLHVHIESIKMIEEMEEGAGVYIDKEPVIVQENYEYIHGLLCAYEAGSFPKR